MILTTPLGSQSAMSKPMLKINPGEQVTLTIAFATNVCGSAKACLALARMICFSRPLTSTLTGQ